MKKTVRNIFVLLVLIAALMCVPRFLPTWVTLGVILVFQFINLIVIGNLIDGREKNETP